MAVRKPSQRRTVPKPKARVKREPRTFWHRLAALGESIPAAEWEKLPSDAARNFDHYAHGSPRQD